MTTIITTGLFGQDSNLRKLPEAWEKDFTITVSFFGSMDGSYAKIVFTCDSCVYDSYYRVGGPQNGAIALTEKNRKEILQFLKKSGAEKFTSQIILAGVHDGWSQSICFTGFCMQDGTTFKTDDANRKLFQQVYDYLEKFQHQ